MRGVPVAVGPAPWNGSGAGGRPVTREAESPGPTPVSHSELPRLAASSLGSPRSAGIGSAALSRPLDIIDWLKRLAEHLSGINGKKNPAISVWQCSGIISFFAQRSWQRCAAGIRSSQTTSAFGRRGLPDGRRPPINGSAAPPPPPPIDAAGSVSRSGAARSRRPAAAAAAACAVHQSAPEPRRRRRAAEPVPERRQEW